MISILTQYILSTFYNIHQLVIVFFPSLYFFKTTHIIFTNPKTIVQLRIFKYYTLRMYMPCITDYN